MTNTKTKKRALFASVLSLLLCISMLVGSTFAWFTDTASTSVNKIQAGNLDIALEMLVDGEWVTAEGKTLDFIKADGSDEILWEPGCTYKLPDLRIVNNGDLHLKYMITITGIDGDAKLNEAIEWTYGAYNEPVDTYVALAPKAYSDTITIQGHMKEEAGNEYQGLSIEGISITVFATQLNVENDSFGPDYDKDAPTLFMIGETRYETLAAAIAEAQDGDTIAFSGVITLPTDGSLKNRTLTFAAIEESVSVIELNASTGQSTSGADLTFDGITLVAPDNHNGSVKIGIQHVKSTTFKNSTIKGNITMYGEAATFEKCEFINYADYNVWTYGVDTTFTNCTFTTGGKAILVYNDGTTDDTVTVTGCTFNSNGQLATDKAAIETGVNTADSKHTLVISNSTANGFAANKSNSPLWGNKNNMDGAHLSVTVDGVVQPIYAYVNIDSVADYVAFGNAVTNNTQYQGISVANNSKVYAELNTDIDYKNVTGLANNAIGNGSNTLYCGTFDGNGHIISNVTLDGNWNYSCSVFRTVGDGFTLKDVTFVDLQNVVENRKTKDIGGIVGVASGNVTFDNVDVTDADVNGKTKVAVLIGKVQTGSVVTFKNCDLTNCTVTAESYTATLVGQYEAAGTYGSATIVSENNTYTNCVDGTGTALNESNSDQ